MSFRNEEDHEQSVVVDWLEQRGVLFTHVPNGGNRNVITGARLKRLGLKRGVPDILIFDPPPNDAAIGVAIEMKRRKGGATSKEQREWLEKLDARGWAAFVCLGADQAIEQLTKLGYGGA